MKRNCEMKIRFTQKELDALTEKAASSNCSREMFCRKILNGCIVQEAPPVEFYALIREVKRVGANLDQLVKQTYTYHAQDAGAVKAVLGDIRKMQTMIWQEFFPQCEWQ